MEWFDSMMSSSSRPQRAPKRNTVYASAEVRKGAPQKAAVSSAPLEPVATHTSGSASPYDSAVSHSGASTACSGPIVEEVEDDPLPTAMSSASYNSSQLQLPAPPVPGVSKARTKRTKNILVLGKQHAGKSAFVNTYRRSVTGGDNWATAPVGRAVSSGTDTYEPYYAQSRRGAAVEWVLVDTAGRNVNHHLDPEGEEAELFKKMRAGMEWKTDLLSKGWKDAKPVPENSVNHVIFVIPATDILEDAGPGGVFGSNASLARVKDLTSRFAWWEKELGNAPFVVVTHCDKVARWTTLLGESPETKIRRCLGHIVHKNRIFCITVCLLFVQNSMIYLQNPEDPMRTSKETLLALKQLHESLLADIDARTSTVLKGRNSRWVEDDEADDTLEQSPSATYDAPGSIAIQQRSSSPAAENTQKRVAARSKTGGGAVLWSMPVA